MNDPEAQLTSRAPKRGWLRYSLWTLVISTAVLAFLLVAWLRQPLKPSPFFTQAATNDDPLETVFDGVMLRFAKDSPFPFFNRVISRLAETRPPYTCDRVFRSSGRDERQGEWYSKQHRLIQCSPEVAEELMSNLHIWSWFAARKAGAKIYPGGWSCKGGLVTAFDFRYEYGRHQGVVRVTIKPPTAPVLSMEPMAHKDVDYDARPNLFELRWEIRESVGPRQPTWVICPDGGHWKIEQSAGGNSDDF